MSRTRYRIFAEESPYFLTCTVVSWLPVFAYLRCVEIVLESWRFLQRERRVRIFGYVILENHLHWIAAAEGLSEHIGRFKSYTARRIIDGLAQEGCPALLENLRLCKLRHKTNQDYQLWQEGSHPQQIQNEAVLRQKLEYMHANPVRRGYVDNPLHWRYSSARSYAGTEGPIEVVTEWR